jgi:hypothetical protein
MAASSSRWWDAAALASTAGFSAALVGIKFSIFWVFSFGFSVSRDVN